MAERRRASAPEEEERKQDLAPAGATGLSTRAGFQELTAAEAEEYAGVEGAGVSDDLDDRGVPLLYIAQKSSPQVNRKDSAYIEGLEVGMAFNSLTGRYWNAEGEGIPLYPFYHRKSYLEWTPREQGGGFHGRHPFASPAELRELYEAIPAEDRRDIFDLPSGHQLKLTHEYYCLLGDVLQPIVVPMSSTNLQASAQWQSLLSEQRGTFQGRIVTKPGYANLWRLKTVWDSNDKGDWYRWRPSLEGPNTDGQIRALCKELAMRVSAGELEAARPQDEAASQTVGGEAERHI